MNKIFYLGTCSTCLRIMADLRLKGFEMREIKERNVTPEELDQMKKAVGSYEALFSRRALKFRAMGLHEKKLTERDYRKLILGEYTFLKRPVFVIGKEVVAGNDKKSIERVKALLKG